MKKFLLILTLTLLAISPLIAQEEPLPEEAGKIPERMVQYIQDRLNLSRNEAEKFAPVFLRYFRDFAKTHKENRGDRLVLQQKIIELRLRYRTEFRQIMDEKRANKVYLYEDEFRRRAKDILENKRDRLQKRPPGKGLRNMLQ